MNHIWCVFLVSRPFPKRWTPSGGSSLTSTSTTSREALWTSRCGTKTPARRTTSWEGSALQVPTSAALWHHVNLNFARLRVCFRHRCTIDLSLLSKEQTHKLDVPLEEGRGVLLLLVTLTASAAVSISDLSVNMLDDPHERHQIKQRYVSLRSWSVGPLHRVHVF